MDSVCTLRPNNPLRGVVEIFDVVWRFTLAVAGRDPVPLFNLEDKQVEPIEEFPQKVPYNLRPRVKVNYKD